MAVSAILWTVLLVVEELVYVSSSFVAMLWEAQLLGTIAEFVALQIWLLADMSKPMGIGRGRCWLIGNGSFLLLQVVGGIVIFKFF